MSNTVVALKKNTTPGVAPTAGDLYQAELAINTADADLFAKRDDGTVLKQSIGSVQSGYYVGTLSGADQIIDSFDGNIYQSAKYVVTCNLPGASPPEAQTIEILILHDGTNVYITRYGLMYTGAAELAEFTVDKFVHEIRLKANIANNSTTIKFTRTVVQA